MNAKDGRKNQACKFKEHQKILSLNNSLKSSPMIWEMTNIQTNERETCIIKWYTLQEKSSQVAMNNLLLD
jgi:hypothetical protein